MTTVSEFSVERQRADTRHRVGIYGWSPGTGGVHQHRIAEPLRVVASRGVTASSGVDLDDDILSRVDTVLAHTLHDEHSTEAWQRLAELGTHRLVLDIDDWMWGPDWKTFQDHYTPDALERLFGNVAAAHVVTTPSPMIAEYLHRHNRNVWVVPNTVPAWLLDHTMPTRERPTVGYQGSPSHARDWTSSVERHVGNFLFDQPGWGMVIYGQAPVVSIFGDRFRCVPWQGNHERYYRSLSMDVGIGPLRDTPFNRAKSSLRAVEYAALGIVAVLPDLPPYCGWVEHGVTGILYPPANTIRTALNAAVAAGEPWLRQAGQTARERARAWTTEAAIGAWLEAWNSA